MKVYIVRHGDAVLSGVDPERPLSEQGLVEVGKIAEFLRPLNVSVEHIWHSGKLRAQQTAEILAKTVQSENGCSARRGLSPNDIAHEIAEELQAYNTDLMIVSHLPFVGILASLLATGRETANIIDFVAGSIACLNHHNRGKWQIEWVISPKMVCCTNGGS